MSKATYAASQYRAEKARDARDDTILRRTVVAEIALHTARHDGGTFTSTGQRPDSGFAVARFGFTARIAPPRDLDDIDWHRYYCQVERYVETHWSAVKAGAHIGTWLNGSDKCIWLDLVDVYPHESYAVDVARSAGELAIFDLSTQTEIAV